MCGFIFGHKENICPDVDLKKVLHHRGPDSFNFSNEDGFYLSHNRLSIIDLSNGSQPFVSKSKNEIILFNGEIYNYKYLSDKYLHDVDLTSSSDTEVILELYKKLGSNFVKLLEGIFSFVILDKQKERIIASRDFFGIKPLCFFQDNKGIYFSSEAKGLYEIFMNIPKEINLDAVKDYVSSGQIFHDKKTFFKNINNFQPGCLIEYSYSGSKINEINFSPMTKVIDPNKSLENYLIDALDLNMVSDVPVSIALSSGLDSTILNELIKNKLNQEILSYTYAFIDSIYDESSKLKELGIDTKGGESVSIDYRKIDLIEDLKNYISIFESPLGGLGTLGLCKLFKKISEDNIKVCIGGEGADEIFGGYKYYFETDYFSQKVQAPDGTIPINNFWDEEYLKKSGEENISMYFKDKMHKDLFKKKIPKLLHFADRAGMSHGVDVRVPFLTYFLYEYTLSKNEDFFFKDGNRKNALKDIAQINKMNFYKSKLDVAAPQREMLKMDKNYKNIINLVETGCLVKNKIINFKEFKKSYRKYCDSESLGNSFFVWQVINLEIFFQVNGF